MAWVDIILFLAAPHKKLEIISPVRIITHLCHDREVQGLLWTLRLLHEKSSLRYPISAPGKFTIDEKATCSGRVTPIFLYQQQLRTIGWHQVLIKYSPELHNETSTPLLPAASSYECSRIVTFRENFITLLKFKVLLYKFYTKRQVISS